MPDELESKHTLGRTARAEAWRLLKDIATEEDRSVKRQMARRALHLAQMLAKEGMQE